VQVHTDEIEEKDTAVQMLAVFIEECGAGFAPYIEEASKIILGMLDYAGNDKIRSSATDCLPYLVKSAKASGIEHFNLVNMSTQFLQEISKAIAQEWETEVKMSQITAIKDIVDETGAGMFQQESCNQLSQSVLSLVDKSLERIEESKKEEKEIREDEDEGEEFDEDDAAMFKEEIKAEYDLQIACAELLGIMMKTHGALVGEMVGHLQKKTLMEAFASGEPKRQKFALFVLDDLVEHLGPNYFTPEDYGQIVKTVCSFVNNKTSSIRQAASYGIGVIAQNSGPSLGALLQECLNALKTSIELAPTEKVTAKKLKMTQFNHARDNAIASLGKMLKHQNEYIDPSIAPQLIQYWLHKLPITHDIEEAQQQYDFLGDFILQRMEVLAGANPAGSAAQLAKILGEAFDDKYFDEKEPDQALIKQKLAQSVRYLMDTAGGAVSETFKQTCATILSED